MAMAASQLNLRGEREYGLKSIHISVKMWYKIFRTRHMHPNLDVDEHQLRFKNLTIWKSIHELGLSYVFRNPG